VASYATKHGVDSHEVEDIRLAVDEAYTNIIKHAYKYDESKSVEIIMGSEEGEFWVSLFDNGKAFDPTEYPDPDVRSRVKAKQRGGVGVYLMKKLMDRIEYYEHDGTNEIRMVKKI
jgi:serine/threonine-protein kinase RsbW